MTIYYMQMDIVQSDHNGNINDIYDIETIKKLNDRNMKKLKHYEKVLEQIINYELTINNAIDNKLYQIEQLNNIINEL